MLERLAGGVLVALFLAYRACVIWYAEHRAEILHTVAWLGPLLLAVVLAGAAVAVRVTVRRRAARREARKSIKYADATGVDGRGFEQLIADLYQGAGYTGVQVSGGAGDLGADVIAYTPDTGLRVVTQCKRYAPTKNVPSRDMQAFLGTVWTTHAAEVAVFVTTGAGFTADAARLAHEGGVLTVARDQLGQVMAGQLPLIPTDFLGAFA